MNKKRTSRKNNGKILEHNRLKPKDISRMIFKGFILGTTYHCRDDPYLNSTTILFDSDC